MTKKRSRALWSLSLIFACGFTKGLMAASVTKVNKKAKTATIDEGSDSGFSDGTKVCVFRDDKKQACGSVKKAKKTSATISIKKITKVQAGDQVNKEGEGSSGGDKKGKKGKGKKGGKSEYDFGVSGYWPIHLMQATPAKYQKIAYAGIIAGETGSLWKADSSSHPGEVTANPLDMVLAAAGELDLKSINVRLGFHYKQYRPYTTYSDYEKPAPENPYVQTKISGSAIGGYAEYVFLDTSGFSMAAGLDLDASTVDMQADLMTDENVDGNLMTGTSSAMILGLRLPMRYQIFLPNLHGGIFFGFNLIVPITALGKSDTLTPANAEPDANSKKIGDESGDATVLTSDFSTALGHDKASFAFEIPLGIVIGF